MQMYDGVLVQCYEKISLTFDLKEAAEQVEIPIAVIVELFWQ
jgi:hypothetical protein